MIRRLQPFKPGWARKWEIELVVNGNADAVRSRLASHSPETIETEALSLEEIFVVTLGAGAAA